MRNAAVSDLEIDGLLAGIPMEGGQLSGLAPIVETIRCYRSSAPSEADVLRFAARAATVVGTGPSPTARTSGLDSLRAPRRPSLIPRMATMVMVVILVSVTAGVAVAANAAAPGDRLYGLDRALEQVGIGAGSAGERLDESVELAAEGRTDEALAHVIEVIDVSPQAEGADLGPAKNAIVAAVDRLADAERVDEGSPAAEESVAALLTYIADNVGEGVGADGSEFGRGVVQLARDIAGGDIAGGQDPAFAPAPDQQQPNEPDTGADDGSGITDGTGPVNGNGNGNSTGNGNGNGNGAENDTPGNGNGNGNGAENNTPGNGNGNGNGSGNAGGAGNTQGNDPPDDSPSGTAPGGGNKPQG
jgi:hypothetical protein